MTWGALIVAVLPVLLAFLVGLVKTTGSTVISDAPEPAGKEDELNNALGQWKKEYGVP